MHNKYFLGFIFLLGLSLLIFLPIHPGAILVITFLLAYPSVVFFDKVIITFLRKKFNKGERKKKEMAGLDGKWNKDF